MGIPDRGNYILIKAVILRVEKNSSQCQWKMVSCFPPRLSRGGVVCNMSDLHHINNHTKAYRHLEHTSRELTIGACVIHKSILRQMMELFSPHVHSLRNKDVNRTDMQNWSACQRTLFPKVRECLWKMVHGLDCTPQNAQALGLLGVP